MKIQLLVFRMYFKAVSFIAPKLASKQAFRLFQKVRKKEIRPRELEFFKQANHTQINTEVGKIDCYQLGKKTNPLIVLVHGWDSNAGSLSKIAFELVANDYQIFTFNLPAHAFAAKKRTNLYECKLALTTILKEKKITQNIAIISHSFGSAVVAYALSDTNIKADKLIFLTNPNKIEDIFMEFKQMIGLNNKAYLEMCKLTEKIAQQPIHEISVQACLQSASFNQLLLIHDEFDRILPFKNSLNVHQQFSNSKIEKLQHVGHYKMLWNSDVVSKCVNYLQIKD